MQTTTPTSSGDDQPGHGDHEHGHDTVSEPKQSREVLVSTARKEGSTEYHFMPHVTWVTVGGTVTWRLDSGSHTATAYHPGNDEPRLVPDGTEAWDSGTLSDEGDTFEHTFDTEGVYHYFCKPHEAFGMIATVVVGHPDLDDQNALATIPDDKPEEVRGKLQRLNEMVRSIVGDGHHDGESSESGHHDDGGHHDGGSSESGHHDGESSESGHHDGESSESGHHDGGSTESGHHDDGGHHDGESSESGHHDEHDH